MIEQDNFAFKAADNCHLDGIYCDENRVSAYQLPCRESLESIAEDMKKKGFELVNARTL